MTAPSRAREGEPIYFGAPPGRKYQDELPADPHFVPGAKDVFEAPSVTTILKAGLPTSWPIRNWDRTTVAGYAVDNPQAWSNLRLSDGSFDREGAVELIANAANRTLGKASDRGTDVHSVFEALGKGLSIPAIGPGREGWVKAVQQFWLDFRPVPVMVECTVYSRGRAPYAGTFDLICWLPTGPGGTLESWIIDLKTGKDVYGNMAYQQVAYLDADYVIGHVDGGGDQRMAIPQPERIGILNARENGTYNLKPLCETNGMPDPTKRAHALAVFYKAYGIWEDLKLERDLVGPAIPVPGQLETKLYASWLLERGKALFQQGPHAVALIEAMWPRDHHGQPVPGFGNATDWTDQHCRDIDERLAFVEAELGMPFSVPPRQEAPATGGVVRPPGGHLIGGPDVVEYTVPVGDTVVNVGPLEGDATAVAEALRLKRLGEDFGPGPIADMPAQHASAIEALWLHPDTQAAVARGAALYEPPAEPDPAERAMLEALRQRLQQPDPGEPPGQASPHPFVEAVDGQTGAGLGVCVCLLDLDAPVHGGYRPEPVTGLGRLAAAAGAGTAEQLPAVGAWAATATVGRPHHAGRWLTGEEEAQVRQRGTFTLDGVEVTPDYATADAPMRNDVQEASFQAQLARLAAAGVGAVERHGASAPGAPVDEATGLTEREAELFASHRGAVLDIVGRLPIDLQRRLDAWSQAEGVGNVKGIPMTPDGLRKLERAHTEALAARLEHQARVERLTKVLDVMLPLPTTAAPEGEHQAAGNLWGWLQAIAATGDGHLTDQQGGPWQPDAIEGPHCVIVEALARALTSLVLFMAPVTPLETEDADTAVVPIKLHVNLESAKRIGKGIGDARTVITTAKAKALELGLTLRPTTQQQVYADPLLVALLAQGST